MKYLLFIILLVAILITAGCVGNKETVVTPTPQIVYVTVTVPPSQTITDKVTPVATSTISNSEWDQKFLDYMEKNGMYTKIKLLRQTPNYYTAKDLNKILVDGPIPASPKLKEYRSVLMDALGTVDDEHRSYSRVEGIDEANKIYDEYIADLNVGKGIPAITSFDVDVISLGRGAGVQITSLMEGEHNFSVKYDVYNGQIKTGNLEHSTPKLFTGEIAQVFFDCYYDCTNTIFRDIQTFNETSMKMESVRYNWTE
jgi:hypothetical protein